MTSKRLALEEIARDALIQRGFLPEFPKNALEQLESIHTPAQEHKEVKDLRHFLWISIDNEDSKDLDQLTYAEANRLYVAIADVDAVVKKGTPIDAFAAHNTTSIYTPTKVFPMLPLKLSNNLTSLNEHCDRCAIVIEVSIAEDGKFDLAAIYHALVHNKAKLNYPCVGAWLEHAICKKPIPSIAGLHEQLALQDRLAQKIQEYRNRQGALEFAEMQLQPILVNGIPVSLEQQERNRAHKLIENSMIAANVAVTCYLKQAHHATLRRVVKTPKRWDRILAIAKNVGETLPTQPEPKALRQFLLKQQKEAPLQFPDLSLAIIKLLGRGEYVLGIPGKPSPGHFDLAEHEYTHATAPNRRFPDLIMQRLLKCALLQRQAIYTNEELAQLAFHCTEKEDDASKIERQLTKCAAAFVLQKELGREFQAMVTGVTPRGTWVRLQTPPVEGKLIKSQQGLDVGDFIKVKLVHVDVRHGHIDFTRLS